MKHIITENKDQEQHAKTLGLPPAELGCASPNCDSYPATGSYILSLQKYGQHYLRLQINYDVTYMTPLERELMSRRSCNFLAILEAQIRAMAPSSIFDCLTAPKEPDLPPRKPCEGISSYYDQR